MGAKLAAGVLIVVSGLVWYTAGITAVLERDANGTAGAGGVMLFLIAAVLTAVTLARVLTLRTTPPARTTSATVPELIF